MADLPFFEKINRLRAALKQHAELGAFLAEKFLVEEGNYVGHQFCFAEGNALWRFDSEEFELFGQGSRRRLPIQPLFQSDSPAVLAMPQSPSVTDSDTSSESTLPPPSKAA